MQEIIQAIESDLERLRDELAEAKAAAARVKAIEAATERLTAALTALQAPQTPAGRKRIGEARRKRKPAAPDPAPTPSVCCECRSAAAMFSCPEPDCDAYVCGACKPSHDARWHKAVAR